MEPQYKRILLKLSGEMLGGEKGYGIDGTAMERIAEEINLVHELGIQIGIVIGGGNIWRGARASKMEMDRTAADHMGMLATAINALALQNILESKFKHRTRVMSAINMSQLSEPYIQRKAIKHLQKNRIVIFSAGTGNPFFTTDTAASLRAREINAEVILKATKVNGIYDKDPNLDKTASKFDKLGYLDAVSRDLKVMDATAMTMCMESQIPIIVFKLEKPGCVRDAVCGEYDGTIVS